MNDALLTTDVDAALVAEWQRGWDARHRLSVIESSGCGRLVS